MAAEQFKVATKLDAETFKNFVLFDNLTLRHCWRSPAIFAGIFMVFAAICFGFTGRVNNAPILALVLLGIGLGLPGVYFGYFFFNLRAQSRGMGLDKAPRDAYTLSITEDEVEVVTAKRPTAYAWERMHGAYYVNGCIYLYATADRSYLLPADQIEGGADELWALAERRMPAGSCHDRRK